MFDSMITGDFSRIKPQEGRPLASTDFVTIFPETVTVHLLSYWALFKVISSN